MSELRAPDPTLDALEWDVLVTWWDGDSGPAVAHRFHDNPRGPGVETECGHYSSNPHPLGSEDARWFAVPCRTCFPDAPPHGVYVGDCGLTGCDGLDHEPGEYPPLAWQVGGDTP